MYQCSVVVRVVRAAGRTRYAKHCGMAWARSRYRLPHGQKLVSKMLTAATRDACHNFLRLAYSLPSSIVKAGPSHYQPPEATECT